ncbi:hypothetical protein [Gordonia effusa]|uniref:hypothetical protein n=1 Tax=Gordonia effusa TaxID=263908 RepID=UPI00110FA815|nr:hypothetical protein [Gordonia effusa]
MSNETSQTASTESSAEGSLGGGAGGIDIGGSMGTTKTTETGSTNGTTRGGEFTAPGDLKPGEEVAYYQLWELWSYDIVSEKDGVITRYHAYQWVPTGGSRPVRGPMGSHLQWKG